MARLTNDDLAAIRSAAIEWYRRSDGFEGEQFWAEPVLPPTDR